MLRLQPSLRKMARCERCCVSENTSLHPGRLRRKLYFCVGSGTKKREAKADGTYESAILISLQVATASRRACCRR